VIVCTPQNENAISCNMANTPPLGPSAVSYSLLGPRAGLTAGAGVLSGSPGFVSLANDNYHLTASSQCIDAADPADPVEDEPAPNGGRRDLGAYGGTPEANTSTGTTTIENQALPVISGTPRVGSTLSASTGTWTNTPSGFDYQWRSGGTAVGTNQATYVPVVGDVGNTVTVTVTARRDGFTSGSATSAPTSAVVSADALAIENVSVPVVSGTPAVGSTLKATSGTWTNDPTGFDYQWRSGGASVGADQATYVPTVGDVGNMITVTVTARRDGYASGTATSTPTAPVTGGEALTPDRPALTGTPRVGKRLTMSRQATPAGYLTAYRWLRGTKLIQGATGRSYRITRKDRGKKLYGAVIWFAADGSFTYAISAPKRVKG
jgi:hypothetical protein